MMERKLLHDKHHVVRHVGPSKVSEGEVSPAAFEKQPISVNWLECTDETLSKEDQIKRISGLVRLTVRKNDKFLELNVADIRSLGNDYDVVNDPLKKIDEWSCAPCHSEIIVPGESPIQVLVKLADTVRKIHLPHSICHNNSPHKG